MIFPLYKYATAETTKINIANRSLRFSSPTAFNDPFDSKISSVIGVSEEDWINEVNKFYVEQEFGHLSFDEKQQKLHKLINRPMEDELLEALNRIKNLNKNFTEELANLAKKSAILCLSKNNSNRLMWPHYADSYKGAVMAFAPNHDKDSCFKYMELVQYSKERFFPNKDLSRFSRPGELTDEELLSDVRKLFLTKDEEWDYEEEYRFFIPNILKDGEIYWHGGFHPEELVGIYLGNRMQHEDKIEIFNAAKSLNEKVKVYKQELGLLKYESHFLEVKSDADL